MIENITIKQVATVISSLGVLVGAAITIDTRYAKESDIVSLRQSMAISIDALHKNILENEQLRVELEKMKDKTEADNIILEKYRSQLADVNQRLTVERSLALKSSKAQNWIPPESNTIAPGEGPSEKKIEE